MSNIVTQHSPYTKSKRNHIISDQSRSNDSVICRAQLDSDTLLIVASAIAGIGAGIGIPIFYATQADKSSTRENTQLCFACNGTGVTECGFCKGGGQVESFLTDSLTSNGDRKMEVCVNCEGKGYITCTTCNGTGIQPRYLDRREFQDDD